MNVGSYRGAAALAAYEKWQEITSQNIAAGSVPGFKTTEVSFASVDSGKTRINSRSGVAEDVRGSMPQMATKISFGQGQLSRTGSDLDFAIQGKGFFQVRRENGQMAYTRNGEFQLGSNHQLITKQGFPVMGEAGPIVFNPGGGPVTIDSEGAVFQSGQPISKLAVYDSKEPQKLQRLSGGLFTPANPSERLDRIQNPAVMNGFVESSNSSPLNEMVNLITVSRAYEANQKVIAADDDNTGKAIQILGNPQG